MLYTVDERDIRESNNDIDAIVEFRPCNDKELKYVFLTYDYETPLRRMPIVERKEEAMARAGFKVAATTGKWEKTATAIKNNKNPQVLKAIIAFRSINYNIDKETLLAFDKQLIQFQNKAAESKTTPDDWKLAILINKSLKPLIKERKEIMELLDLTEEGFIEDENENASKVELSTIDEVNAAIIKLIEDDNA